MNENHPGSSTILLDGFVRIAGGYAHAFGELDTLGVRAMGYYAQNDCPTTTSSLLSTPLPTAGSLPFPLKASRIVFT